MGPERAAADVDAIGRGLTAATAEIPDPGDLIALLPGRRAVGWVRRGDGLVGWGEAARLTLPAGADRFTAGEKWLRELFDDIRVTGGPGPAMPGLAMPAARAAARWRSAASPSTRRPRARS